MSTLDDLAEDSGPTTPRQYATVPPTADLEARLDHLQAQGGQLLDEIRGLARVVREAQIADQATSLRLDLVDLHTLQTEQRVISLATVHEARDKTIRSELHSIRDALSLIGRRVDSLCGLLLEDSTQREEPDSDASSIRR